MVEFILQTASGCESIKLPGSSLYRQPYCGCIFSEKDRYYKGDQPEEIS